MADYQQNDFDTHQDLKEQEMAAHIRHLEPANPVEFIQAVSEVLRDHHNQYCSMLEKYKILINNDDASLISLKRLEALTTSEDRITLNTLRDNYYNMTMQCKHLSPMLYRCKKILDEVSIINQMVGESLKEPLADRHKKVAAQQELGLRLRDIDDHYAKTTGALENYQSHQARLMGEMKDLQSKVGTQLPPDVMQKINNEDELKKAILSNKKRLRQKQMASSNNSRSDTTLVDLSPPLSHDVSLRGLGQTPTGFFDSTGGKALAFGLGAVIAVVIAMRVF